MPRPIRAVVFDLDGTLIDSVPDLTVAVNKLLAEQGRRPLTDTDVAPMVGDGVGMLVRRALAASGGEPKTAASGGEPKTAASGGEPKTAASGGEPDGDVAPLVARFVAHYEPHAAELTRPFDGVVATLERLRARGIKLAVCTNKVSGATRHILRALEIAHLFDAVVGGDDTPRHKPDPVHVQVTLERLGVGADAAAYVGDSENDVKAAKGAGLPVVLVTFGYARIPVAELGGDILIDRFADLEAALEKL